MKNYFEYPFIFDQNDVIKFAEASGDKNPIHLDQNFAKKSIFKKKILHGFLGASVFSKVFGTINPGFGTIYLKQSLVFLKPMFTGENYIAKFKLLEKFEGRQRGMIKTQIIDSKNTLIIDGEALIQHESLGG